MKKIILLLPIVVLLSGCSTYVVKDNGRQITETYTNSDGTTVKCVTETGYTPGGFTITPGGVMVFPSYRKALGRECVTNRKQSFQSSLSGKPLSSDERLARFLGMSEESVEKLQLLMSQETPGENARAELAERGISQEDLSAALTLAVNDKVIEVEKINNNPTFKVVSEYLGTTPAILFTALRISSAAIQVDAQIRRGIRIQQNTAIET